jgi:type VI secretion system protein VasG
MVAVDIKSLLSKMNRFCSRSLEASAGLCVSRTNYEVTVEHVLHVMAEEIASDLWCALKHYEIDPGKFQRSLLATIERYKTGNASRPVFSPILVEWIETGWMIGTIDMNVSEIRSGVLLATILTNPARFCGGDYHATHKAIPLHELKKKFFEITEKSIER